MTIVRLIEYAEAAPEVRVVYDEIMKARGSDWVNNFWKPLAHDPALLRRTWESVKQVMAPASFSPSNRGSRRCRLRCCACASRACRRRWS
jgi:hypothetical protein